MSRRTTKSSLGRIRCRSMSRFWAIRTAHPPPGCCRRSAISRTIACCRADSTRTPPLPRSACTATRGKTTISRPAATVCGSASRHLDGPLHDRRRASLSVHRLALGAQSGAIRRARTEAVRFVLPGHVGRLVRRGCPRGGARRNNRTAVIPVHRGPNHRVADVHRPHPIGRPNVRSSNLPVQRGPMAALHPQIVHFTIVLVIVGVAFRLLSLAGRPAFAGPAAATLLILAAASSVLSVQSGTAAHGPVERVPGSRPAVVAHEEWGERTQNDAAGARRHRARGAGTPSFAHASRSCTQSRRLVGLFGCLLRVRDRPIMAGALVYSYAGGVGLRSGDPKDVERLLLAGYYHQAHGRSKEPATPTAPASSSRRPRSVPLGSSKCGLLAAESLMLDQKNPRAATDALAAITVPDNNRPMLRAQKERCSPTHSKRSGRRTKPSRRCSRSSATPPEPAHSAADRRAERQHGARVRLESAERYGLARAFGRAKRS